MFTDLYKEEEREEVDIGGQEEMKRRDTDPASNQFPKCSPSSGTQRFRVG